MKIAIATDHNGVNEKKELIKLLSKYRHRHKRTNLWLPKGRNGLGVCG